jgi:hypothetical protein
MGWRAHDLFSVSLLNMRSALKAGWQSGCRSVLEGVGQGRRDGIDGLSLMASAPSGPSTKLNSVRLRSEPSSALLH